MGWTRGRGPAPRCHRRRPRARWPMSSGVGGIDLHPQPVGGAGHGGQRIAQDGVVGSPHQPAFGVHRRHGHIARGPQTFGVGDGAGAAEQGQGSERRESEGQAQPTLREGQERGIGVDRRLAAPRDRGSGSAPAPVRPTRGRRPAGPLGPGGPASPRRPRNGEPADAGRCPRRPRRRPGSPGEALPRCRPPAATRPRPPARHCR